VVCRRWERTRARALARARGAEEAETRGEGAPPRLAAGGGGGGGAAAGRRRPRTAARSRRAAGGRQSTGPAARPRGAAGRRDGRLSEKRRLVPRPPPRLPPAARRSRRRRRRAARRAARPLRGRAADPRAPRAARGERRSASSSAPPPTRAPSRPPAAARAAHLAHGLDARLLGGQRRGGVARLQVEPGTAGRHLVGHFCWSSGLRRARAGRGTKKKDDCEIGRCVGRDPSAGERAGGVWSKVALLCRPPSHAASVLCCHCSRIDRGGELRSEVRG